MKYLLTTLPRETDLYKSGDFFLNPIMILLNCIFVYYYGNGNMDNYGQKKHVDSGAPPHCPQSPHIIDFYRMGVEWVSVCLSVCPSVHTFKPEYL